MKVLRVFDQFRRDCSCDLECEGCGAKEIDKYAYDDDNYWVNVIPNRKCKSCDKSTKDLNIPVEPRATKYASWETV